MHRQTLFQFFTTKASLTKFYGFMVHLLCFQKPLLSYTFTLFLTCSVFGTISLHLPICPVVFLSFYFFYFILFFFFIKSPQPCFHKSYPQSETFLNIRVVPGSVVFCSNTVVITTPSSSMHFFSFFDVLPSAPTATGMTLMLLMFHILLISLFRFWYLSIFSFSFSLTHIFRYSNINYGTTSPILIQ